MEIPTSPPSAQGVSARRLLALVDALDADPDIEPHGVIVQRHGHRILEAHWAPHTADRARLVYSLSKSFTSAALGLQIGEGRLGTDDLVADHLPDETADADPQVRSMRIRHIASMATGHDHETLIEAWKRDRDDPLRGFFACPLQSDPGTVFAYNQMPVLALATILQRNAGQPLSEYLRPRLLDPLGIERFSWRRYATGVEPGFSAVFTTLDAIARLGQVHLDDGVVDGRRVLPEGWVAQASSVQTPNPGEPTVDWQQGYGFGMWMSRHGYRGDGAYGQLMLVLPDQDVVVAVFAHAVEMQAELDHIWAHVLPACDEGSSAADDAALAERVAHLSLPTAAGRTGGSALPDSLPDVTLTPAEPTATSHRTITGAAVRHGTLVIHEGESSFELPLATAWTTSADLPMATSAALLGDGTIAVDVALLATPHRLELTLDPAAGTIASSWPAVPLFGAGLDPPLHAMVAPVIASTPDDRPT